MLDVIKGRVARPRRVVIYGVAGIGKSSWAASAPNPIMVQTENGSDDIGCPRLPVCLTMEDLQRRLRQVLLEDHDYKTLIVDTVTGSEPLIHNVLAASKGEDSVADIAYGRGYDAAAGDIRKMLFFLDKISNVRGMTIILIGHSKVERFEDPANEAYDRYSLNMHKKAAAEIMKWADEVLFANYKTFVRKTEQGFRERNVAVGTGERFLFTREMPAYFAKNRLGLPPELPMPDPQAGGPSGWDIFAQYIVGPAAVEPRAEIQGAGAAAPVVAPTVPDAASSEPASQAPAPTSPPPEVVDAAQAAGLQAVDLTTLDATGLTEIARTLAFKMSQQSVAKFKRAIKDGDLAAMREVINYTLGKPDVSGIVDGGN